MTRRRTAVRTTFRSATLGLALGLALTGCAGEAGQGDRVERSARDGAAVTSALRSMAERAEQDAQFEKAAAHYGRLAERLDDPLPARLDQARLLRYAGQPQEAMLVLQRLLDDLPERGAEVRAVKLELAKAQLAGGLVPDAAALLEDMRAQDPGDAPMQKLLGIAYDRLNRPQDARTAYQTALALAPDDVEAANNYALSLAMTGDIDQGVALLEKQAKRPGAPLQVRQNLALLYAMKGDVPRAERMVRQHLPADLAERAVADLRRLAGAEAATREAE
ncbi:Flp pilus assembly protein TadD [Caenispirillum salinarum AK4]|uniref:Flp pilus assembly protein TadD n=1 Tax=Caenispirillum salinarum AK4 TaxID=1238182 RepID=K9GZI8_9PROT|nr:tetratricopeptide repeat protein [Caenispirillum salinarum]EKV30697.1 Flp pilus assembly protein TadD [Caenispirillum salinarum AK4]